MDFAQTCKDNARFIKGQLLHTILFEIECCSVFGYLEQTDCMFLVEIVKYFSKSYTPITSKRSANFVIADGPIRIQRAELRNHSSLNVILHIISLPSYFTLIRHQIENASSKYENVKLSSPNVPQ